MLLYKHYKYFVIIFTRRAYIFVCIRQNFNDLTIWPGYFTTIRYHEDCFLLGLDLIFKLQRKDTALRVMYKIKQNHEDDIQVNTI